MTIRGKKEYVHHKDRLIPEYANYHTILRSCCCLFKAPGQLQLLPPPLLLLGIEIYVYQQVYIHIRTNTVCFFRFNQSRFVILKQYYNCKLFKLKRCICGFYFKILKKTLGERNTLQVYDSFVCLPLQLYYSNFERSFLSSSLDNQHARNSVFSSRYTNPRRKRKVPTSREKLNIRIVFSLAFFYACER